MGRKVKLRDTENEYGDSDTAYRAPNGKYYSNQRAYELIETNKVYWQKSVDKLLEVMCYKQVMKFPTYALKRLKEYEAYGYDVLYDTIVDQADNITNSLKTKQFNSEVGKACYVVAIIDNHINDTYKLKIAKEKAMKNQNNTEMDIELCDFDDIGITKKGKNVSSFLGVI